MKRMRLNKKGISPLIATVLLIGFTVALAGVVITWGGGFVERITSDTEERTETTLACTSDLRFEIDRVNCGTDEITIENKGNLKINKLRLRYFNAEDDVLTGGDPESGSIDAFKVIALTLDPTIPGGTVKIEAVASITVEGQEITCGDAKRIKKFSIAC